MYLHIFIILFIASGMFWSVKKKKLTADASITGGVGALIIYFGVGSAGIILLVAFFYAGSFSTSWKFNVKEKAGIAEGQGGQRKQGQVLANSGIAIIMGGMALVFPQNQHLFLLMLAGAFSSATSDTLSSEMGNLYGRRFYNIISWKPDLRGRDGVVSLEGSLFGIAGAVFIASIYCLGAGWGRAFFVVALAGIAGNISDSILGATLERPHWLSNNGVNFINTLIGAFAVYLLQI